MNLWMNYHWQAIKLVLGRMRNSLLSSFLICLVIAVALCLPSLFYLSVDNLSRLTQHMQSETEISLFLKLDADQQTMTEIQTALSQNTEILEYRLVTKEEAWQELQAKSKNNTDISSAVEQLGKNPLPDAFFVQPKSANPEKLEALRSSLQSLTGVEHAMLNAEWAKRLDTLLGIGKKFILFISALLAAVLLVLIGNTIRMQILTQQDEIEVSYLIGATNSFIRTPFLYAGIFYGLFGGVLSIIMVSTMIWTFNNSIIEISKLYGSDFSIQIMNYPMYITIIVSAATIGWIGSMIAVNRAISTIRIR